MKSIQTKTPGLAGKAPPLIQGGAEDTGPSLKVGRIDPTYFRADLLPIDLPDLLPIDQPIDYGLGMVWGWL